MACRLLYVVGQLRPGGQERQLYYLLKTMNRERYAPAVAVWNFSEEDLYVAEFRALHVPLYSFPKGVSPLAKLRAFCDLVRVLKPEVIHSYSFYTNLAAYCASLGRRGLAIGSVRGDFNLDRNGCGPWLGRVNAFWPRTQIFNSFVALENARRSRSLFVPRQIHVVRNGVDLGMFKMAPLRTETKTCVLATGSLWLYKRWDRLLLAALTLYRRGFDFLVRIVGDGPQRQQLERQAQVLGIADHIEFIYQSNDIPGLLANATFLVHTSDSEGCPNAVMEAMACGRAVVATDAGDVSDLVVHGETGFVVPRADDQMLLDSMLKLLVDRDLCRRMGEAGRAKAERDFGLDRFVSETLAAYRAAGWGANFGGNFYVGKT